MHKKRKIMYALRNKVQLIGCLGGKPDVRSTESGKKYARFSVATNEVYRNAAGDKVTETQWHNLVAWGKIAEIAEKFFSKETINSRVLSIYLDNMSRRCKPFERRSRRVIRYMRAV